MQKNKMKGIAKLFALAFALILGITAMNSALAEGWIESKVDIEKMTVYVEGAAVWHGFCRERTDGWECKSYQYATPALEREGSLNVRVVFTAAADLSDLRVKVWIAGYRNEIEAKSAVFDAFKGMQYSKSFTLELPDDIDARESYTLHVKIEGKRELRGIDEANIEMAIQRIASKLQILSAEVWSHKDEFKAGDTVYVDIVLKNRGYHLLEDVFVKLSIPELKLARTIYIGDIGSYDNGYEDSVKRSIALSLPEDAAAGSYALEIEAYNAELSVKRTVRFSIVKEDKKLEPKPTQPSEDPRPELPDVKVSWEAIAMAISIALAVAIIVLLVILLMKQRSQEKEEESYY